MVICWVQLNSTGSWKRSTAKEWETVKKVTAGIRGPKPPRGEGAQTISSLLYDTFWDLLVHVWVSLVAQMVKCLPAMQETWVRFLGQEDSLEKEMAILSSTLAWKIPWMEEPDRLQSMGSQRVGEDWEISLSLSTSLCYYCSPVYEFPTQQIWDLTWSPFCPSYCFTVAYHLSLDVGHLFWQVPVVFCQWLLSS